MVYIRPLTRYFLLNLWLHCEKTWTGVSLSLNHQARWDLLGASQHKAFGSAWKHISFKFPFLSALLYSWITQFAQATRPDWWNNWKGFFFFFFFLFWEKGKRLISKSHDVKSNTFFWFFIPTKSNTDNANFAIHLYLKI